MCVAKTLKKDARFLTSFLVLYGMHQSFTFAVKIEFPRLDFII